MIITNGFWAGVLTTLFAEMTLLFAIATISGMKQRKEEEKLKEEFRNSLRESLLKAKENCDED